MYFIQNISIQIIYGVQIIIIGERQNNVLDVIVRCCSLVLLFFFKKKIRCLTTPDENLLLEKLEEEIS